MFNEDESHLRHRQFGTSLTYPIKLFTFRVTSLTDPDDFNPERAQELLTAFGLPSHPAPPRQHSTLHFDIRITPLNSYGRRGSDWQITHAAAVAA
ncbi:unnamed protein product [Pieris macdunnoughi]|uniref:Uncharacterized protein n=1 Tax=Pieris macdunnoughi TaxID=345717 RepID=A0A821URE5_9NEOP|nr:unnamed protein product [Pieris macdunnoughi]